MISRTYVINLARRPDKKDRILSEFLKLKGKGVELNCVIFEAVDGNNPEHLSRFNFKIPNWTDLNSGKPMTNGEVGCALSHWSVWKDVVDCVENGTLDKDCRILVLEDDVVFLDNFMERYQTYTSEITYNCDLLYLHRKPLNPYTETKISTHIVKPNKSYWACAYVITYQCAKKFMNANYLENLIPSDEFIPIMHGCNVYGFEKLFSNCEKIDCYAVQPSLVKLTSNAFNDSETFHSGSYVPSNKFNFDTDKQFRIVYIGPTKGNSFHRFTEYCKLYLLPYKVIDEKETNDFVSLRSELQSLSEQDLNTTLMLVVSVNHNDFCNTIPCAPTNEFIDKYKQLTTDTNSIVSAVQNGTNKTMFVGWANKISEFINHYHQKLTESNAETDINLANLLLISSISSDFNCVVEDIEGNLFQLINEESDIVFSTTTSRVNNKLGKTPSVLYANSDSSVIVLNKVENYTGYGWNEYYGYHVYPVKFDVLPKIYLSIRILKNANVTKIAETLDYPKELVTVSISRSEHDSFYQADIQKFLLSGADYYFYISGDCIITRPSILKELLELNKDFVGPLMRKGTESWTNYWGDIDPSNGYYKRSFDYFDIIGRDRVGCWNVPYLASVYLIKKSVIEQVPNLFTENSHMWNGSNIDMRLCHNLRKNNVFMYLSNLRPYGHIDDSINLEVLSGVPTEVTLYDLPTRKEEWEKKYLHPEFLNHLQNFKDFDYTEICNDVYSFPLFTPAFCKEVIEVMDKANLWSKGGDSYFDPRIGGVESYPTQDTQLYEVGLDKQWHYVVFNYVAPFVRHLYNNYKTKDINLAFVVKYDMERQSELAPHHDSSTYTLNVALNEYGSQYMGGGCEFIRHKFIWRGQKVGYCTIHAGKLLAYHRALPITSGKRYILVSFVN
ncbi:procollagen-lysine2-oxoglutarate 5-dioxygenase [Acanthamoeba polyphaga mimivirus]|uniref:procollagen-lysine 5-dioxygenase n=1 Tax=Acanthamoeba polyphaga mimivirus TaxID=212035 RepID=A0A0G2Y798_MIMIV|nr:procollagen-lysine2-oxoglutarate 5-dioxygenase [Acanthamoeba polyphaga mimivirus]